MTVYELVKLIMTVKDDSDNLWEAIDNTFEFERRKPILANLKRNNDILQRAIPALVGTEQLLEDIKSGKTTLVDTETGKELSYFLIQI